MLFLLPPVGVLRSPPRFSVEPPRNPRLNLSKDNPFRCLAELLLLAVLLDGVTEIAEEEVDTAVVVEDLSSWANDSGSGGIAGVGNVGTAAVSSASTKAALVGTIGSVAGLRLSGGEALSGGIEGALLATLGVVGDGGPAAAAPDVLIEVGVFGPLGVVTLAASLEGFFGVSWPSLSPALTSIGMIASFSPADSSTSIAPLEVAEVAVSVVPLAELEVKMDESAALLAAADETPFENGGAPVLGDETKTSACGVAKAPLRTGGGGGTAGCCCSSLLSYSS